MKKIKIAYAGPGLSGRRTTAIHVSDALGGGPKGLLTNNGFTVSLEGQDLEVEARVNVYSAWLVHDVACDVDLDPRIVSEIDFMAGADGMAFVVDMRRFRMDASLEAIDVLKKDLLSRGRNLEEMPTAFLLNWMNEPSAASVDWALSEFNFRRSSHMIVNAKSGMGAVDSFLLLVRMIVSK